MLQLLLALLLVAAGIVFFLKSRQAPAPAAPQASAQPAAPAADNAATRYVGSLQNDVQRADVARDKMNAAIGQSAGEIQRSADAAQ